MRSSRLAALAALVAMTGGGALPDEPLTCEQEPYPLTPHDEERLAKAAAKRQRKRARAEANGRALGNEGSR